MAYTTYQEIEADFKDTTFSSTSNVKQADVTQFIVEADALINSYVGQRYVVPVVSGDGLNLLKFLARSIVTGRIKKILEVKQEKSTDANQNVVSVYLSQSQVVKMLEQIRDDNIKLDGATALETSGGFFSKNYSEDVAPVIEKDTKQW